MNIKHSDFPSFLFHSSTSLLISFLFSFPSLPFLFFFPFYFRQFWLSRDKCSSDGELTFSITPSPPLSSQPQNFYRVPMIQRRGTAKNCQWTMRKTGKLDNKVLRFFSTFSLSPSNWVWVERFRNNVDTEIQRFWLKYIYMYPCIVRLEIFIFHVNSEKIGRCNCPARNRLHRRKVHGLSKNSLDGLECGGWE